MLKTVTNKIKMSLAVMAIALVTVAPAAMSTGMVAIDEAPAIADVSSSSGTVHPVKS